MITVIVIILGTAFLLTDIGKVTDPVVIASAMLHDAVEDTKTTLEEIKELFGDEIYNIVKECTDDKSLPKQKRKDLQIEHGASNCEKVRSNHKNWL